jgi:hypothetical protein
MTLRPSRSLSVSCPCSDRSPGPAPVYGRSCRANANPSCRSPIRAYTDRLSCFGRPSAGLRCRCKLPAFGRESLTRIVFRFSSQQRDQPGIDFPTSSAVSRVFQPMRTLVLHRHWCRVRLRMIRIDRRGALIFGCRIAPLGSLYSNLHVDNCHEVRRTSWSSLATRTVTRAEAAKHQIGRLVHVFTRCWFTGDF